MYRLLINFLSVLHVYNTVSKEMYEPNLRFTTDFVLNIRHSSFSQIYSINLLHLSIFSKKTSLAFTFPQAIDLKETILRENTKYRGTVKSIFNDPDLHYQWYFIRANKSEYQLSHDLDVLWFNGITGIGVVVAIVGEGVDEFHKDLTANYIKSLSRYFISDTGRIFSSPSGHPTISAGLISASANNYICGVGAAPHSKFTNLQIFKDGRIILGDLTTSKALKYKNDVIDIYLMNWVIDPREDIRLYPGYLTKQALISGYIEGRNRLGNLFVMGSGNQRVLGNNCAFNGFLQMKEVLVFGAISNTGLVPLYLERCNSILAASLSVMGDRYSDRMYSTTHNNRCENSSTSTHASTAISAGILTLLISKVPVLTIRQVIYLIASTSIQYDPLSTMNAAGFHYSNFLGFGLMNANGLVSRAQIPHKIDIAPEHTCTSNPYRGNSLIMRNSRQKLYIYSSGCLDLSFCVTEIEIVSAVFSINAFKRNSVYIYLTSPSGTKFMIVEPRPFDVSSTGFKNWKLKLMGYFGEKAVGVWVVELHSLKTSMRLVKFQLIFYGTCHKPNINVLSHNIVKRRASENRWNCFKNISSESSQGGTAAIQRSVTGDDASSFANNQIFELHTLNSLL